MNDQDIMKYLQEMNLEVTPDPRTGDILVISPTEMKDEVKKALKESLKDVPVKFVVGPKQATLNNLASMIRRAFAGDPSGPNGLKISEPHARHAEIDLCLDEFQETYKIWDDLCKILTKDGYFTTWTIKPSGETFNKAVADEMVKNAKFKDNVITKDKIDDLHIMLNATKSVDEFLRSCKNAFLDI